MGQFSTAGDNPDTARHSGPEHATTEAKNREEGSPTGLATTRHDALERDIFEHPYVKRLETQVEKWEGKYHEQVRRTEEIQMKSTQQILELQRMTAIGQSQTLADFMLKAKDWILGEGSEPEKREAASPPSTT